MEMERIAQIQSELAGARQRLAGLQASAAELPDGREVLLRRQMAEARRAIADCKRAIQACGGAVEDLPEDEGAWALDRCVMSGGYSLTIINNAPNQGAQGVFEGPMTIATVRASGPVRPEKYIRLMVLIQQRLELRQQQAMVHQVRLALGLRDRADQVEVAWRHLNMYGPVDPRRLSPSPSLLDLFDIQGRQLLILGAPGAGKTTLLLDLAKELIAQAQQDAARPIPIILSLASWRPDLPFERWLMLMIAAMYTSRRLAQELLDSGQLLLLLDGFDEVTDEQRERCAGAINAYLIRRQQRDDLPTALVVCSRSGAYDRCRTKLHLSGSIEIEPLDLPVIEQALARFPAAQGVLDALHANRWLRGIATSPLIVNVLLLAYPNQPVPLPPLDAADLPHAALWNAYVQRMFQQRPVFDSVEVEQVLLHLRWLATTMRAQDQRQRPPDEVQLTGSEWLLDDIQPSLLTTERQRAWYRRLFGLGAGLLIELIVACGAIGAIAGVLLTRGQWIDGVYHLVLGVCLYIFFGVFVSSASGWLLAELCRWPLGPRQTVLRNISVGLLASVGMQGLLTLLALQILAEIGPRFDVWEVVQSVVFVAAVFGVLSGWLIGDLLRDWTQIRREEDIWWSWPALWRGLGASWRLSLSYGAAVALLGTVWRALFDGSDAAGWLVYGLTLGLSVSGITAMAAALSGAWQARNLPNRSAPGEGLRRSVKTGLYRAGISLAALLLAGCPALNVLSALQPNATVLFALALSLGCVAVVLSSLRAGLGSLLKHYALRAVLASVRSLPLSAEMFLDNMAAQMLLERDGAVYRFRHEALRDHIAALTPEQIAQLAPRCAVPRTRSPRPPTPGT